MLNRVHKRGSPDRSGATSFLSQFNEFHEQLVHQEERIKSLYNLDSVIYSEKLLDFLKALSSHSSLPLDNGQHSEQAIRMSIVANLRSLYQAWVFLVVMEKLGTCLLHPRDGVLYLSKAGAKSANEPNCILETKKRTALSLFLDKAFPVSKILGHKDFGRESFLRPDILGFVSPRKAQHSRSKRPHLLVECKESRIWHRTRKEIYNPLTLDGRKIVVTHLEMLGLYYQIFKPRFSLLVSMLTTPSDVARGLESRGIKVLNTVGFDDTHLNMIKASVG